MDQRNRVKSNKATGVRSVKLQQSCQGHTLPGRTVSFNKWCQGNETLYTKGWYWMLPIPHTKLTKTHNGPHQALPLLASLKMDPLCNNLHTGNCPLFPYLLLLRRSLLLGPEDTELLPAWMLHTFVQKLQAVLRKLICQCWHVLALSGSQNPGRFWGGQAPDHGMRSQVQVQNQVLQLNTAGAAKIRGSLGDPCWPLGKCKPQFKFSWVRFSGGHAPNWQACWIHSVNSNWNGAPDPRQATNWGWPVASSIFRHGLSLVAKLVKKKKKPACLGWTLGSIPGFGRSPGEGERLPTPVFWPGEFHGLNSPLAYKESYTTEQLSLLKNQIQLTQKRDPNHPWRSPCVLQRHRGYVTSASVFGLGDDLFLQVVPSPSRSWRARLSSAWTEPLVVLKPKRWQVLRRLRSCWQGCWPAVSQSGSLAVPVSAAAVQTLSCVWLFATPWTGAPRILCPWDFSGKNAAVATVPGETEVLSGTCFQTNKKDNSCNTLSLCFEYFSHIFMHLFLSVSILAKYLFSFLSESLVIKHKDILTLYHSVWGLLIFYESIKVSACQGEEWTLPKDFASSSGERVSEFSVFCRVVVFREGEVWSMILLFDLIWRWRVGSGDVSGY